MPVLINRVSFQRPEAVLSVSQALRKALWIAIYWCIVPLSFHSSLTYTSHEIHHRPPAYHHKLLRGQYYEARAIISACICGELPTVNHRPVPDEARHIFRSGNILVYNERSSGISRGPMTEIQQQSHSWGLYGPSKRPEDQEACGQVTG